MKVITRKPAGQPRYDPQGIEPRWRARWAETGLYHTPEPAADRPKFYCLDFFPYPSGQGLSVGHGRNYVPTDVVARYYRMRGYAVLHPMGWDAFGLPAENEAIKRGRPPQETTACYAANYRRQMDLLGCSYDWEREISSSSPEFYRWTQWFFLLLYRRGLAYRAAGRQWWCPVCKTVLANEQVNAEGVCWRGHPGVYKRELEQWYFRITAYADELLEGLATLDWPEHILAMQRNWIGRSEGVELALALAAEPERSSEDTRAGQEPPACRVFTTRPDTIYGVTFLALAPEHPLALAIATAQQREAVAAYIAAAARRGEIERLRTDRTSDGVFTGAYAVNPINGERVPVYVADYVLPGYGTGAIMGVPAHDERDHAFATAQGIPMRRVVVPGEPADAASAAAGAGAEDASEAAAGAKAGRPGGRMDSSSPAAAVGAVADRPAAAYTGPGVLINSGPWDGLDAGQAAQGITAWLVARGSGRRSVEYRMRDWLISRQRYWGAPIPIVYCERCGTVPVPAEQLPVRLPAIERWLPGEDGRSPLANVPEFVNTACPQCGGPARRETDTLDGFACSSWYFLRFASPGYSAGPFDPAALARWAQPDLYVGGAEHAVMHLLYARFWTRVMADAGIVPFREPFPRLRNQGAMHARAETGEIKRMAKSAGNVVTPDSVAERYGADALRIYLLFMAPFENNTIWTEDGLRGARRFLERSWRLAQEAAAGGSSGAGSDGGEAAGLARGMHRTVRLVTADIEALSFNTAVAKLMECLNALAAYRQEQGVTAELAAALRTYVLLLAPFAPYLAEELWAALGGAYSVHSQPWPGWDAGLAADVLTTLVVQVDGRVRDRLEAPANISAEEARAAALARPAVSRALQGRSIGQVVFVPGRLINLVTA